jgi:hypothetical protein
MTFPHTATVQRQVKVGTKSSYADQGTTQCFLQPLDSEFSQLYGITFGKGSSCYLPYTADVNEGDRLVISGKKYGVRGMREHNYGSLTHKRAVVETL